MTRVKYLETAECSFSVFQCETFLFLSASTHPYTPNPIGHRSDKKLLQVTAFSLGHQTGTSHSIWDPPTSVTNIQRKQADKPKQKVLN